MNIEIKDNFKRRNFTHVVTYELSLPWVGNFVGRNKDITQVI